MAGFCLNQSLQIFLEEDVFVESGLQKERAFVMLVYFLVCVLFLYIYYEMWKTKKIDGGKWEGSNGRLKSVSEMVTLRQFSIRMPAIIEGFVMLYKGQKDGTRAMEGFWRSTNHSPLFRVPMPINQTIVCVMEPDLIRKCLGSGDARVLDKPKYLYDIIFTEWMTSGLLSANGETWHTHRKVLNRYFGYKSLSSQLKILNKYGSDLLASLDGNEVVGEEKLLPLMYDQLLTVILEVLLGRDNVSRKETSSFLQHFRKIKSLVMYKCYHPENNLRLIWWLNPMRKVYDECISFIKNYVDKGIEAASEDVEEERETSYSSFKSCLHHLLQSHVQKDQIRDQIATLLFAGHETTESALHFLLQHLAEHPHIQEKCQEEVDFIFSVKEAEDIELTLEDLAELKYLERCILETLRLTTTVPLFFRQLSDSIELGGYHLKKDTMLVFSSWLVHKNPEIYPNPEEFDPDRFLPDMVKKRHSYAFFPFSSSSRNCIGWKLAMMEMKVFMAYLISKYTLHTSSKMRDVKVLYEITTYPEKSFGISLTRRIKK